MKKEGICLAASRNFGRFQEVTLEGEDGNSIRLRLQKNVRVTPGGCYRFYFRDHRELRIGQDYVDALLSVGNFLGMEKV